MNPKDQEFPTISPENTMDPEQLKNFSNNPKEAVFVMSEEEHPLFICFADMKLMNYPVNVMMSIQYTKRDKKLQMIGRLRFDKTGNKQIVRGKDRKPYSEDNMRLMKDEIREMIQTMLGKMPFKLTRQPMQLEFKVDESMESIVKTMNDSNLFNIGQVKT